MIYWIEAKATIAYEAKEGETEDDVRAVVKKLLENERIPHDITSVRTSNGSVK